MPFERSEDFFSVQIEEQVDKVLELKKESENPNLTDKDRERIDRDMAASKAKTDKLVEMAPESSKVQNSGARQSLQSGDFATGLLRADKAVELARQKKDPELMADGLTTRALGAWYTGDYPKAMRDADQVLQVRPNDPVATAVKKLSEGKTPQLGAALKNSPANTALQAQLNDLLSLSQLLKSPELKVAGGRAAARQQANKQLDEVMGKLRVGDAEGALSAADKALKLDPSIPDIYMQRALAWGLKKDTDKTIEELNKAVTLWKALPRKDGDKKPLATAHAMRAGALLDKGRAQPAFQDANTAVELNPNSASAHFQRGRAREALKQTAEEILADYKRAAEIDPKGYQDLYEQAAARIASGDGGPSTTPAGGGEGTSKLPYALIVLGAAAALGGVLFLLFGRKKKDGTETGGNLTSLADNKLARGAQVGHFRIESLLGRGGMGEVWKAWDSSLNRWVALKRLPSESRADEYFRESLAREAQSLAKLKHPAICSIHSIFKHNDDVYLVFEHVDGTALVDTIEEHGPISASDCMSYAKPLTSALDYAHQAGVIHRDIKPSNIMIEHGQPKLLDFGIARVTTNPNGKTNTAMFSGTPAYSPPEASFGHVTRQGDLYSLAVTLYYMLTARLPFEGAESQQAKLEGNVTPISKYIPFVPGLDDFFKKALAPRPEDRFQTGAEMWKAFSSALVS